MRLRNALDHSKQPQAPEVIAHAALGKRLHRLAQQLRQMRS